MVRVRRKGMRGMVWITLLKSTSIRRVLVFGMVTHKKIGRSDCVSVERRSNAGLEESWSGPWTRARVGLRWTVEQRTRKLEWARGGYRDRVWQGS